MRISSNKIKDIMSFFKQELKGLYDEREIRSFIFLVMEEFIGYSSSRLLTNGEETVSESALLKINFAIKDLKHHKPLQYILGYGSFYGSKYKVTPDVLIPRPETEELVKWVIDENKYSYKIKAVNKKVKIKLLDIGTGSGCIAITIKKNMPEMNISALDISKEALKVAQSNAESHNVDINFIQHDVFDTNLDRIKYKFDTIVSNPPYVRDLEKVLMSPNVLEYEPDIALYVRDNDPLSYYEAIADFAKYRLKSTGHIYLEINEALASETAEVFSRRGYLRIHIRKDINGKERMMKIAKK